MNRGTLYIFTGPSGTGKGTMLTRVMHEDQKLFLSVSATTRTPRAGEINGVHYFFLSREEFDRRVTAGEFLEHATYAGNSYGTLESPVQEHLERGNDVVLEIEVQGAMQMHQKRPDAVMIFVAPPSFEELERRLAGRGTENDTAMKERLEIAKWELSQIKKFDYVIVNDDLEESTRQLAAIFIAERCRNREKAIT